MKSKVFIIDDSAVFRQVAREILDGDPDIEVVGAAADPIFALERMKRVWPDVILLDIDTPRMHGLTFLRKLMAERPLPVVVCSASTGKGSDAAMHARAAGAVSVMGRPELGLKEFLLNAAKDLVDAVKAAAGTSPGAAPSRQAVPLAGKGAADGPLPARGCWSGSVAAAPEAVVAIGTSTGGTQALEAVLTALPATCPGIVIVQHMPERFTALFAHRLDSLCQLEVREARDGDRVIPGRALVAPGGRHMTLQRNGAHYQVQVTDGPLVNRHKPSVDVLFRSVAKTAGSHALGVIMTGMGDDGAQGLREMHDAGARTVAEDETSCVVFGMPKEAIKLGGVDRIVPLQQIAREILAFGMDPQRA